MTEKGCDNCYYTYFDEKAYPCSLCIRGIERTDQWQPSKKTKADRKTEPQTDNGIGCSKCESRFWCMDRDMPHAVHCNNYGKTEQSTDCSWK